nr:MULTISPECIES: methyltransferase [unclassified Apibacter]
MKSLKVNNIFKFKKFNIFQNNSVFKVGTDSVLLGCFADIHNASHILDIGTGTGILSLMCAQRNPISHITAMDSEYNAYSLALENFKNSSFSQRITGIHCDLDRFFSDILFDYIICNPPYFKISEVLHRKHPVARQQIKLNYHLLIKKSASLLSQNGKIGYIFPIENEQEILELSNRYNLFPNRIIYISGIRNGKIKRIFLELSREDKNPIIKYFVIEEKSRIWSEEYKKLTSDFYL